MQYSPKLRRVAKEINDILVKEDVAGLVVLHLPGFAEFLVRLDPSYSCARIEGNAIHVKAKTEDFGGDNGKRNEAIAATSNMLRLLGDSAGPAILGIMDASEKLDNMTDAQHGRLRQSSNEEENN